MTDAFFRAATVRERTRFGSARADLLVGFARGFPAVTSQIGRVAWLAALGTCIAFHPGCRRDPLEAAANDDTSATTDVVLPSRVHFPESLHVQDESVNRIVLQAMEACADGDYDAFRLLWTARQEPLARDEFDHGWEAVQRIQILALEEIKLGDDEAGEDVRTAYAIFADVQLDPQTRAGMRNPQRQAVSIIVKDNGEWKLAKAPKAVREWLRERVAQKAETAEVPDPAANDRP